ncbi:unnamed protein product, partial [Anisakis simplex]|uniref:Piwi domain-containing protein n=1 Tax=Anisakis simplex TaxID=6269 RepID=A0A0M3K811_ANISI
FDVVGKDQQKKKISVAEYFKTNVGIALKFARLPLIIERCESGENYYPMELLVVCENQRVKQTQQSSEQIQAMISVRLQACAALPSDRKRQTSIMTQALKLDGATKNRWFDEYNVKITKNLAVLRLNMDFRAYVNAFIQQCRQHGMQIGKPIAQLYVRGATENQVDVHMNKAKQMGAKLVHFITSDKLLFHGRMKLLEASEQIVTLDLKTSTAVKAPQRWQTLDNIINKVNLKLGGINFGLRLETEGSVNNLSAQKSIMNPNRIIVGMDVAHPPAINRRRDEENLVPSIVGYSSNCKKHPLDFIGGYRYARANQEEIADSTITDLMVESMKKFKENRNILPNHIILLRDGISEGQYTYVIQNEVEQVKSACGQIGGNAYRPHITFVVATKMHNLRLFKKDIPRTNKASEQNIKPGTVVDKHIVSPVLNEFYLNSHSAFQGTAKTPRYTKLFDTSKMSNDEIQAIVFALAFNHQIVNSAVSLPAPIFIADRMATRGQNNFVAQFGDISEGSEGAAKAPMDLKELNAQLGYADKPLSNCRFNA